ncbi:energy-coupling factor ABC transporter ATP-binding protein [Microbacterium sp. NPDC077663]|uniref:energy-coupling factor ABC transporter ATP-binding protein n=1 Tax=Microbacterium sp. NPDC077663 TaxID=3364189 RepID=UPI0037CAEA4A
MTTLLRLTGVSVRLADVDVLRAVDLALDARTVAVIGDNGSGKSTLARLIGGLVRPSTGRVEVLGLDAVTDAAALRRRVAVVFSNPDAQIIMPTVAEDVAFSLRADRLPRAERDSRVATALDRFGLTALADRPAYELSGGQKQLLALCGAFVRAPDLVVADEPTAFLDGRNAHAVAAHLLADTGHRLLVVTHDLDLAARCDVAVRVHDGRIADVGEAEGVVAAHAASWRC